MALVRVYRQTFAHLNQRGYLYVWANLLCVVLSLPIITAPAAWAGLVHLSYCSHTQPRVTLEDFWDGFKTHLGRGMTIGAVTLVIWVVNVTNLLTFTTGDPRFDRVLHTVWVSAILGWTSLILYLFPILEAMHKPTLRTGLRNAALMVLKNPFFTLGLWLGILPIAVLSSIFFPAWLLLTLSTIAILTTAAVLDRLGIAPVMSSSS
jgi:uncharacterized membrane protein YesL